MPAIKAIKPRTAKKAKVARQPKNSIKEPEDIGPRTPAVAPIEPHKPTAAPWCFCGMSLRTIAKAVGTSKAIPAP